MVYLYVKQHNITGLKYFGKTTRDPNTYHGSGIRWLNHLRKHGRDVSTPNIWEFEDLSKCSKFALQFSKENHITEDSAWANLKPENGRDGGFYGNPYTEGRKGRAPWNKGMTFGPKTDDQKKQVSKTLKAHWAKHGHNRKGCVGWNKGIPNPRSILASQAANYPWTCPHCGKSGKGGVNLKRWHGDNCKLAHDSD